MPLITTPRFNSQRVPDHFELNYNLSYIKNAHYFWALHPLRPYEELLRNVPMVPSVPSGAFSVLRAGSNGSTDMSSGAMQTAVQVETLGYGYSYSFWLKLRRYPVGGEVFSPYGATNGSGGIALGFLHFTSTVAACMFVNYSHNDGQWELPPLNEWVHVCIQFQVVWYGFNKMRAWYNGRNVYARDNGPEGIYYGSPATHYIGWGINPTLAYGNTPVQGEMRQFVFSHELWSQEEIIRQAREPYEAYLPYIPKTYFFPVPGALDPTHVPDFYVPNTDLTWVQKATHIWAIHPMDPLKADKGGLTLEQVAGTVAPPSVIPSPANVMEFHGGSTGTGSVPTAAPWYYRTLSPFIFGDAPQTAGNQTPPAIGGLSFWIYLTASNVTNFMHLAGQMSSGSTVLMSVNNTNRPFFTVNGFNTCPTILTLNTWHHLCGTNDGSLRRLWLNGVKVTEAAQNSMSMADEVFQIAHAVRATGTQIGLTGRIRLVSVINGAIWTDAEILEQYQRPYGYYTEIDVLDVPIGAVEAAAFVKGVSLSPGALLKAISRAQAPAFAKGITYTPGTAPGRVGVVRYPAQAKGIAPQGGLITRAVSKVATIARAKGIALTLPPFLSAWAKAIAPGFAEGITGTGGTAVGNIAKAPAPARGKGILPQGGLIAQTISRVMALARVSGVTTLLRDFTFHGSLTRMIATAPWASIERERRTLLGQDSRLELLSISGHEWILEMELSSHWVARRARFLGTSDEWLLEIPEDKIGKFKAVQDLAGARIYTHGQTLTFRIIQANRPLKAGHLWEFQLEAIGDKD